MPSHSELLAFATAFTSAHDMDSLLAFYTPDSSLIEHGENATVPTLGKEFNGIDGVRSYFEHTFEVIAIDSSQIVQFTVDEQASRVACVGKGKLTWKETRQTWEEIFIYLLDFDNNGKVKKHQVWPDSGSMYLAKIGRLDGVKQGAGKSQLL